MRTRPNKSAGFTLIELIAVMLVLAIAAALVAPSLLNFRVGRFNSNTATTLMGMANYARAQAESEGRTYRLNFDPQAGTFWLTAQGDDGTYTAPGNDFGMRAQISDGSRMDVTINPQANVQMNIPSTVTQNAVQLQPGVSDPIASQVNTLMQNQRTDTQPYVEFQPSGRTDTALVKLTDRLGNVIEVSCASATETFRILQPGELQ
jgi:prepilin-type N-terminal cleavage/methylation domain-containing protein